MAYSPSFVAAWCNTAVVTADKAVKALVAMEIIKPAGTAPSAFGKETSLFLP